MIVAHLQHHLTNYPDTDIQDLNTRLANSEFEKDLIVEEKEYILYCDAKASRYI